MSDLFTAITDATELPTPPLRLRRIYLHGVGPAGARFDPLDLNLDTATGAASRVMLSLTNTGGKSTLIALVSSLIVPASREQISGRQIGDYLLSGDTGHVVCEWEDAMARTTYVTGVVMEWRDGRRQPPENQRSTTAMTRRWYGFRTGDALPGIDELPFVTDGHRTPQDRFVAALRETFAQHPTATGTIATTQIEWSQILDDHTNIDPVLFSYQMRMNDSEAGAEALLGSFNTPESVVRFFIDALSNGRDIAEFATRLTKYAAVAGQRPHLEAFAKFCAAVGPDIEAVVLRASEADEHAVAVRQAAVAGAEHHAALVSRIGRDRTLLVALAQERSAASDQVVALRRDEGRVPDIRSQLRFERARADAAAAAQLLEEHKGRETAATLESEAWDAVEDLLALSLAESRRDSAKLALDAADEGLAPLRAATEAAAASYAARLATLISAARTAKGTAETTKQREDQAFAAHQRDERAATRHRTDAETNLRSIDEATGGASAAAQRATADGWIEHGERPSVAQSRWVALRDADRAKLDELDTRAGRAEVEFDDANTQRRTLDKTLVKLRAAAQRAGTKLGSFDADLAALSGDTATQLIGDTPTGPGDVARLAEFALDAARDADRRAADHEQRAERAETELAHLDSTGMAPANPDVVEVQRTLLAANIGASTGLEWIERNVANPDDREAFITDRSDLAAGVVVNDATRFSVAVEVLAAAELAPRTAVVVSTAPTDADDSTSNARRHVVIPYRATWDRQWAELTREALAADIETHGQAGRAAREHAAEYRRIVSLAGPFGQRWVDTERYELTIAVDDAIDAVDNDAAASERLEERAKELRTETLEIRRRCNELRDAERTTLAALAALQGVLEAADRAVEAEARRPGINQDLAAARRDETAAVAAAELARKASANAQADAVLHGAQATQLASELRDVGVAPSVDPGGNRDTVRAAWQTLAGELTAATEGLVEADTHRRAVTEYNEAARRFDRHRDVAVARAKELAGTIDAADSHARTRSTSEARAAAQQATLGRMGAATRVDNANDELLKAAPPDTQRNNFIDLDNVPEWKPATPDDIDGLLSGLDAHAQELRALRSAAEEREREATELHTAVASDVASMEETLSMWRGTVVDAAPFEPFTGSRGSARETMLAAANRRDEAADAETAAKTLLREAVARARATAAHGDWKDIDAPLPTRIRGLAEADLIAEASRLSGQIAALAQSTVGDLDNLDTHRTILRDCLIGLCSEQRRLLRLVTAASALPPGLGELSGQPAIKITFQVAPEDEVAGHMAALVDKWALEVAAHPNRAASSDARLRWMTEAVGETVLNRKIAGRYSIEVLKPRIDGMVSYCSPRRIPKEFSGGQVLTLAVLVFCALSKVRAQNRVGGARPAGALILDNPFGKASAEALIAMQHRLAAHSGVQLICATGLHDAGVDAAFTGPGSVVVKLRNDSDIRRNLSYLRVRGSVVDGTDLTAIVDARRPRNDPSGFVDAISYQVRQ